MQDIIGYSCNHEIFANYLCYQVSADNGCGYSNWSDTLIVDLATIFPPTSASTKNDQSNQSKRSPIFGGTDYLSICTSCRILHCKWCCHWVYGVCSSCTGYHNIMLLLCMPRA